MSATGAAPGGEANVVDTFAEVARSLAEQKDLETTLQRLVDLAAETVPGAEHASVSVVRRRREVATAAATNDICRRIDEVQYEVSEGPCLDAIWQQERVRIDDLGDTDRWPSFAQRASDIGIRSMLAFRMFTEEDTLGALNLYASQPLAFDASSEQLGAVFASHAALAWDHAKETEGLQAAAASRNLIGQAQGVLMTRYQVDADTAFAMLQSASMKRNVKLRDVAHEVATTRDLRA